MKKTVELNQHFRVSGLLYLKQNAILYSVRFPLLLVGLRKFSDAKKHLCYFYLLQAVLVYSVKYSLCNLCEAFNDSILANRLEAKQRKKNIPFSVVVARAFVSSSCCCCCCFAEYINQMYLERAARAARFFCLFGPLISL